MSQQNVEIAREGYRAFNEGGVSALRPYLLAEVVWETPKDVPESGIYRGIDAVMAYVEGLSTAFDEVRLEPGEFFAVGEDQVLVVLRLRARGHNDTSIDMPWCHLWTFRDGKISAVRTFLRRDEALEAVGLSE